jgi:hypothetical protein
LVRKNVSVGKLQRYLVWIQFPAPTWQKNWSGSVTVSPKFS